MAKARTILSRLRALAARKRRDSREVLPGVTDHDIPEVLKHLRDIHKQMSTISLALFPVLAALGAAYFVVLKDYAKVNHVHHFWLGIPAILFAASVMFLAASLWLFESDSIWKLRTTAEKLAFLRTRTRRSEMRALALRISLATTALGAMTLAAEGLNLLLHSWL